MNHLAIGMIVVSALVGASALAPTTLVFPEPRPGTVSPIGSPCGYNPDPGRTAARMLLPGSTVEVRWTEWINHPGHFRISFDADGQNDFVDPFAYDSFYVAPSVLLDNIPDVVGATQYSATIVLPNIECDNCTLQLMQVRYDAPPFTSGGDSNDIHRACADVTLSPAAEFVSQNGFEG